jgi:phosphoribosylaminoimidazole carboxylase PurE protein
MNSPQVSIIMGSSSDSPVMEGAAELLNKFNIPFEMRVISAHRSPERMLAFAKEAHTRGIEVIIAGAGGAAHLPGMVASLTHLPVIGVPVKSAKSIEGLDSLLSIVQMPAGIPVATMAVDGSENAGLLAVRILALKDAVLSSALIKWQEALLQKAAQQDEQLKQKFSSEG